MGTAELISQRLQGTGRQTGAAKNSGDEITETIRRDPTSSEALRAGWQVGTLNVGHIASFGFLSGAVYLAPMMHFFYGISNTWPIPIRIAVNSLVVDPLNYCAAMVLNSVAHGKGVNEGLKTVETKLPSTVLTGFMVWPPVQLLSFWFVPLHWRVFVFNSVSLCWNTWLNWQVSLHLKRPALASADQQEPLSRCQLEAPAAVAQPPPPSVMAVVGLS